MTTSVFFQQTGIASYYAHYFHGRTTACGEKYNMHAMTAAHPSLPFNTYVRVTHLETDESVIVRINDRGPYWKGRIIDLSLKAAQELGMVNQGVARVKLEIVTPDSMKPTTPVEIAPDTIVKEKVTAVVTAKPTVATMLTTEGMIGLAWRTFYNTQSQVQQPTGMGVQVGTYKYASNALTLAKKLEKQGFPQVSLMPVMQSGTRMYIVFFGSYTQVSQAEPLRQKLNQMGLGRGVGIWYQNL